MCECFIYTIYLLSVCLKLTEILQGLTWRSLCQNDFFTCWSSSNTHTSAYRADCQCLETRAALIASNQFLSLHLFCIILCVNRNTCRNKSSNPHQHLSEWIQCLRIRPLITALHLCPPACRLHLGSTRHPWHFDSTWVSSSPRLPFRQSSQDTPWSHAFWERAFWHFYVQ